MSSDKNRSAQEERAKRLRQQIGKITKPSETPAKSDVVPAKKVARSPHESVQRRMQEIAEQKRNRTPRQKD